MTTPDTRPLLDRALDQAGRLVASTDPADGPRPTPCEHWDVTALTSHLLAVVHRIGAILNGADAAELPRMIETADTDAHWQRERSATNAVLATDDVLERVVTVPLGHRDRLAGHRLLRRRAHHACLGPGCGDGSHPSAR